MIQLKKKIGSSAPKVLTTKGKEATELLIEQYKKGVVKFTFDSDVYGHETVKELLVKLQNDKCCFCESKITHISYGDVEHFRPKGGWVQEDETLNKPGYFWLAYDWDNLFLSCQICNQRFKKNFFPLIDNANRAQQNNNSIEKEAPIFIHPVFENPEEFIAFNEEVPFAINSNKRGDETIKKTGIDRETLNEIRREKLNPIRDLYNIAKGIPNTTPEIKADAWNKVKKYFVEAQSEAYQYSSMIKCFFKENPLPDGV